MQQPDGLVDADALLALTAELRDVRELVEAAAVSGEQRDRWLRTIAGIATGGGVDIERARGQLRRLRGQVERVAGS